MLEPALITLKIFLVAAPLLALIGGGAGYFISRSAFRGKRLLSAALQLPVVLPPTVTGFYLLTIIGHFNGGLLFTFYAALIGALIPALPIMIQSARAAFAGVDRELEEAAYTIGRSRAETFIRITLPLARRPLLVGLALSSARAIGDFGVTLMIAGNIPGITQTLPLYIYGSIEGMRLGQAHAASALLSIFGVLCLIAVNMLEDSRSEQHAA